MRLYNTEKAHFGRPSGVSRKKVGSIKKTVWNIFGVFIERNIRRIVEAFFLKGLVRLPSNEAFSNRVNHATIISDKSLHISVYAGIRHGDYCISLSKFLISPKSISKISRKFFGQ